MGDAEVDVSLGDWGGGLMGRYRINHCTVDTDTTPAATVQTLLARAHRRTTTSEASPRPRCLCRAVDVAGGAAMYVARINGDYVLKRMPGTGADHAPGCRSYEPPPELSGAGEVLGSAITPRPGESGTTLVLGFALTRNPGRTAPTAGDTQPATAGTDGTKLTLRALLHYLWDDADLTRWTPALTGKRNWAVVRSRLLRAAADKITKGAPLAESLYIPEVFSTEHRHDIAARRVAHLRRIAAPSRQRHKLLVLVSEVKQIAAARFGHKVVFKHVPDCPFLLPDYLHHRLQRAFEVELALWEAVERTHLVAIATVAVSPAGIPTIDQAALMPTTASWIPYESVDEKTLLDQLTDTHRAFRKSLRYNMTRDKPLAALVLLDTDPATACYLTDPDHGARHSADLDDLVAQSALAAWRWNPTSDSVIPALPPPTQPNRRSTA